MIDKKNRKPKTNPRLIRQALNILSGSLGQTMEEAAQKQHEFVCHGDGSECFECQRVADPERLRALDEACDMLLDQEMDTIVTDQEVV